MGLSSTGTFHRVRPRRAIVASLKLSAITAANICIRRRPEQTQTAGIALATPADPRAKGTARASFSKKGANLAALLPVPQWLRFTGFKCQNSGASASLLMGT